MKVSARLCCVAIATLLLPACATITRGTKQKYVIESTPTKAEVALSTGVKCVTPCKLKLKRKDGFVATVTKAGFETSKVKVSSKFSGGGAAAGAGNILVGGIIGGIVDGSNGSMNNLTPNPLRVTLKPAGSSTGMAMEAAPADADAPMTADAPEAAGAPEAAAKPNGE